MAITKPLVLLFLVAAVVFVVPVHSDAAPPVEEDPEVTACKQQCARQPQFGAAERRRCVARCEEYGRDKRRRREEEGPERELHRCLHECRAGPPKPGCERRCREAYERSTGRGSGGEPSDEFVVTGRVAGARQSAAAAAWF